MNKIVECIKSRRSTRNFLERQITDNELNTIIECGTWAPSGHNKQPWFFTVLQNSEMIDELNLLTKEALRNYSKEEAIRKLGANESYNVFYNAPTVIIVSYEKNNITEQSDCSAAIQNVLLASESIGLATCWNGFVRSHFVSEEGIATKQKYEIPENYTPYYAIAVGYADGSPRLGGERRDNIVKVIK